MGKIDPRSIHHGCNAGLPSVHPSCAINAQHGNMECPGVDSQRKRRAAVCPIQ